MSDLCSSFIPDYTHTRRTWLYHLLGKRLAPSCQGTLCLPLSVKVHSNSIFTDALSNLVGLPSPPPPLRSIKLKPLSNQKTPPYLRLKASTV
jgi:hypothetical protein